MSVLIDLTNTPTINSTREEWRAGNKPPYLSITPVELQWARETVLMIPPSLKQQLLPPLHLSIRDFINMVLPEQCSFSNLVKSDA
ncbi:hypothetical protein PC9H_007096 [Pleurotus ostreatus]|uniref:Uncharacterized protein n=1 Tax=Pleurotus ostreatus TaxID=5322 RepID=A0A8H7DRD5_PLEOS|nr:uncharacterized protein PC9H_007096 [Pleurotus ostreatus]KAF7427879.1 hypothetical protein PC9H_007096 [Pleurotus ostreatus]